METKRNKRTRNSNTHTIGHFDSQMSPRIRNPTRCPKARDPEVQTVLVFTNGCKEKTENGTPTSSADALETRAAFKTVTLKRVAIGWS